jgi:hypothetical protein
MIKFDANSDYLYQASPDDVYTTTREKHQEVNLNEVTYYARLGFKPHRIGPQIGIMPGCIWANYKIRQAYELGVFLYELKARTALVLEMDDNVAVAIDAVNRSAGIVQVDHAAGLPPETAEQQSAHGFTISVIQNAS